MRFDLYLGLLNELWRSMAFAAIGVSAILLLASLVINLLNFLDLARKLCPRMLNASLIRRRNARFLINLFLPPKTAQALLGDLEERYHLVRAEFGPRRAWLWYWVQTFWSLGPLVWAWLKRITGLAAAWEVIRRIPN